MPNYVRRKWPVFLNNRVLTLGFEEVMHLELFEFTTTSWFPSDVSVNSIPSSPELSLLAGEL